MNRVFDEVTFGKKSVSNLFRVFLVFYLTPVLIFVNRLGLPAKSSNSPRAATELAGLTPQ